jgi:hypothetical protein
LPLAREEPGAFEHDVDLEILPRQFRRIALCAHEDAIAVHDNMIAIHRDRGRKLAVRAVVLGEMRVGLRVTEVVDRHELQLMLAAAFIVGTQNIASNAPVSVDCHSNRHCQLLIRTTYKPPTHAS